jgi:hypothetical protein
MTMRALLLGIAALLAAAPARAGFEDCIERDLGRLVKLEEESKTASERVTSLVGEANSERPPVKLDHSSTHDWTSAERNGKTPLPRDAEDTKLFGDAVYAPNARGRPEFWSWNETCGCWYRYQGSEQGGLAVHWNGMTEPTNPGFTFRGPNGSAVKPDKVPWDFDFIAAKDVPKGVKDIGKAIAKREEVLTKLRTQYHEVFGEEMPELQITSSGSAAPKNAEPLEVPGSTDASTKVDGVRKGAGTAHLTMLGRIDKAVVRDLGEGKVLVEGAEVEITKGEFVQFKPRRYVPHAPGTAKQTAERAMTDYLKRTLPADKFAAIPKNADGTIILKELKERARDSEKIKDAVGGTRRVFEHPTEPGKIIKIYDPELSGLDAKGIAKMMQREQGISDYLVTKGVNFAKSERVEELLDHGIQIQDRVVASRIPLGIKPGDNAVFDAFLSKISAIDKRVSDINSTRFELNYSQNYTAIRGNRKPVGIDLGNQYENVRYGPDGSIYMFDL